MLRQAPEILAKVVDLAKGGDVPAAKEILARCLPSLRPTDRPALIALGADLAEARQAILAALGAGELTPDQASSLAGTIGTLARSNELIAVEQRLSAIERLLNERSN